MTKVPWSLLTILTVGGIFRFYGLTHGFPYSFHIDEWHILRDALEMYHRHSLRPPTYDYPSFLYYYYMVIAGMIGWFQEPSLYALHLAGRISSAFFGTASIAATYILGKRCFDKRAGLLGAAFLAFTVTALRESHFATIDTLNVFFIILAMDSAARIALKDDLRNYLLAGITIGLAAGTKYNGALLLVPVCLAHLLREAPSFDSYSALMRGCWQEKVKLCDRRLALAGITAMVVFLVTTPFALVDAGHFLGFLAGKFLKISSGIAPWNHHYFDTLPYMYYIQNLMFWGMGPLLEIACICGLGCLMFRQRKPDLIVACWLVFYFAFVGAWFSKASRYTLPMLPFLALSGATLFVSMKDRWARCGRRLLSWGWALAGFLVLGSALLYSVAFLQIYSRPHTGLQALQWALKNIPQGSTVLLEPTAWERPPLDGGTPLLPLPLSETGAGRYGFRYLDVLKFSDGRERSADLAALLHKTIEGVDYIVISMRWYEGILKSPVASPVIRDYYRDLLAGRGSFAQVAEFRSYPSLAGLVWNDDWAELNFRIFDHPKVLIFQRKHPE